MTLRAASYSRVSSDKQSTHSVDDQSRLCAERVEREGWQLVEQYEDRAISGASIVQRPGVQRLLADAYARKFDVLIVENLDRLSRSMRDTADLYAKLTFHRVKIITLNDGEITPIHVGVGAIVNSEFLRSLAHKTHRGVKSRVLAGKNVARKTFGYDIVRRLENGELIRGEIAINPTEAALVIRIFEETTKGRSAKKLAAQLNAEKIPGPTGGEWSASAIYGSARKGNGILRQRRYIGLVEWNRTSWEKHPDTGRRVPTLNDPSKITVVEAPELRIVPQDLWDAVQARMGELSALPLQARKRAPRLLSGLLRCSQCGSGMALISRDRVGCSAARNRGTCTNRLTVNIELLEQAVVGTLQSRLMRPDLVAVFCREYTTYANRLRMENNAAVQGHRAELERVDRRLAKIVQAIGDGIDVGLIREEANQLQRRKDELRGLLETTHEAPTLIHPSMSLHYQAEVQRLVTSLNDARDREEAAGRLRKLIDKIVLTPTEDGKMTVDLHGELGGILLMSVGRAPAYVTNASGGLSLAQAAELERARVVSGAPSPLPAWQGEVVAGTGFEPVTFRL